MPKTRRTDAHAPTNLVTEDYDYFASGYFGTQGEPGFSPLNTPRGQQLLDDGWTFGSNDSAGGCYHCGARLRYYALLLHRPTHTIIWVGETCADGRFDMASADFHALRKQAKLDRKRQRTVNKRLAWFAVDPDRELAFLYADHEVSQGNYGWQGTLHELVHRVNRYGSTGQGLVRVALRDMARKERIADLRAAEAATAKPVIEGKQTITGKVLSVKTKENDFGTRLVMTVADDRGFKVWGTAPSGLGLERGDRVQFNATVTKSDRDETFGFFKRPTKAINLSA